jgi:hypothetical protein
VALEIELADGRRDIVIVRDRLDESSPRVTMKTRTETRTDAELAFIRLNPDGSAVYSAICSGMSLESGDYLLNLEGAAAFHEIDNQ